MLLPILSLLLLSTTMNAEALVAEAPFLLPRMEASVVVAVSRLLLPLPVLVFHKTKATTAIAIAREVTVHHSNRFRRLRDGVEWRGTAGRSLDAKTSESPVGCVCESLSMSMSLSMISSHLS